MSIVDVISILSDIMTVLAVLLGGTMAVFVYFQLAPVLQLRILPRWSDENKQHLILRFEVENKSRVRVYKPWGRIQVLKHGIKQESSLSHWVPFEESTIRPTELPAEWSEPTKIFASTEHIYPGETIAFERLCPCPEDAVIVHIGLQAGLKMNLLERIITRKKRPWQQTTTCFVVK
ncbi:MAG: hypothetical protein JXA33_01580 [Anaerolineae bacterium]|nr:hypothetical protein [Anaerolineae bacterium]